MENQVVFTVEEFNKVESGAVIKEGLTIDSPVGINMTNSGKELRYVVKKGWADDWCIYTHFSYYNGKTVAMSGDKVHDKDNIQRVFPCTDEMMDRYRL